MFSLSSLNSVLIFLNVTISSLFEIVGLAFPRVVRLILLFTFRMHLLTFLSALFLQSSNIESNSEGAWRAHYFFPEPVVARFMRFNADQVKDSKCLNDLVVSGCTLGKTHIFASSNISAIRRPC